MELKEYIEAVKDTLQYWLDIHTNPQKWAEEWTLDDVEYTFKNSPILSNDYFTFDWRKSALKQLAREERDLYNICKGCGCINENGYDCSCGEPKEGEGRKPTIDELTEWFTELEVQPSESALIESLEKDGFKAYRAGIKDTIAPVVREVKDVLKSFQKAKNPVETIQAITWANHVCHVNGNIIKDYGDRFDIDYRTVDIISQRGLQAIFSEDEINEYLGE